MCSHLFGLLPLTASSKPMHQVQFRQIMRDAEIARVILPVVRGHHLSEAETEKALAKLNVPRAANVARISIALGA